ncbi:MAG: glycoside hydrolase family 15 protein [Patescibacteria group bacterium]
MPRSLVLGNGSVLVGLDRSAEVRDFYFPYVGLENHVGGHHVHKVGVWVNGRLRWLDDPGWEISVHYAHETFASDIIARNAELEIELRFTDVVYNEKNIFIRKVEVMNRSGERRSARLFFHQQFEIYQSHPSDTAYFDPAHNTIIHYKGERVFLINGRLGDKTFNDFSTGVFEIEGKEGTYKDAEDGVLEKNPIEHGRADSVISFWLDLEPQESGTVYYWLAAAKSLKEANDLNFYALKLTPEHLIKTTRDFWSAWVNKENFTFYGLDDSVVGLFKKSLFLIRAHVGDNGSIIASGDSEMLQYGRDTYSYVWPRDAAISAFALDKAGDFSVGKKFFQFCNDVINDDGYFMHKYRPDKSLGSSWHPWIRDGKPELPIQEDETALVIYALWKHYELSKDIEFIEELYNSLIKKAADFMVRHIHHETGLPKSSYDLWEEKYGTSTFTASATYAALLAAARFAKLLGKTDAESLYLETAERIRGGILEYLYDAETGMFLKLINFKNGERVYDRTIDISSVYGIYKFGVLAPHDERVGRAMKILEEKLLCKTPIGGVPRYVGDIYYRISPDLPGNPWFITTLWYAQYFIEIAKEDKDLKPVREWLSWVARYALPSGILSEQLDPYTGGQVSTAPLTWSHSEFVITVIQYLEKLEELGICKSCYHTR